MSVSSYSTLHRRPSMTTQSFSSMPEPFADDDSLDIADIIAVATNELTSSYRFRTLLAYGDDDT